MTTINRIIRKLSDQLVMAVSALALASAFCILVGALVCSALVLCLGICGLLVLMLVSLFL